MIHFFIGTKAQFIKLAPIMVELASRGIPYRYVDSGQHAETTRSLRQTFGLARIDASMSGGDTDITTIGRAVVWAGRIGWACIARRNWLRKDIFPGGGICMTHGDTLSTLLGLETARAAGLQVAHVEAGLRSFDIWDPFPEEIIRRWCMRRAHLLFAPGREAAEHLEVTKVRGQIVEVDGNTVVDALRLSERMPCRTIIPDQPYAVATCHRMETITRRRPLQQVVSLLCQAAEQVHVLFVVHKPTLLYICRFGLKKRLAHSNIRLLPMQEYFNFTYLIKKSQFVMTDGGSVQEECGYLNKPCLLLRRKTERSDGLGHNVVLWKFDDKTAQHFLANYDVLDQDTHCSWPSPSKQIVDALERLGYCNY